MHILIETTSDCSAKSNYMLLTPGTVSQDFVGLKDLLYEHR